jgi:two-component sensor histidine kinase
MSGIRHKAKSSYVQSKREAGIETGGPSVQTPTHQSFGTRLIEQGFVGELRGEAHLSFEASGVVCSLNIPLASLVDVKHAA